MNHCTDCALSSKEVNCVPSRVGSNPKYLLLLSAPAARGGFDPPEIKLLDKALALLGVPGEDVALGYTLRCPLTCNVKSSHIKACTKYWQADVKEIQPEVIICLGGIPFSSVMPKTKGGVSRNRLREYGYKGIPVFVTYSPQACINKAEWRRELFNDLETYLVKKPWDKPIKDIPVHLVNNNHDMEIALKMVEQSKVVGFDIETRGFDPYLLTVGITTGVQSNE